MKSLVVHYRNKYPKGSVHASDSGLDAYDKDGGHRVCLRKNGAGQVVDVSSEMGCIDRHDLAPLPKEARVHKLFPSGMIGPSEEADERAPQAEKLASHACGGKGKVPSIEELSLHYAPKASTRGLKGSESWEELKKLAPAGEADASIDSALESGESSEEKSGKKSKKH